MADDGTGFLSAFTFSVAGTGAIGAAAGVAAGAAAAGAATSASGSAGGFTMSKDEMTSMLTKAKQTRTLINDQLRQAVGIAQIDPPGDDASSQQFTDVAVKSGNYYLGHLGIQKNRYDQLIAKLETALGLTVETDEDAGQAVQAASTEGEY